MTIVACSDGSLSYHKRVSLLDEKLTFFAESGEYSDCRQRERLLSSHADFVVLFFSISSYS